MDNITNKISMPEMIDEEDLEIWAYYKAKKLLIEQSGGFGRIEFKFQNNGFGTQLGTKGYSITDKARKKQKPNRRPDMRYAAAPSNYSK